MQLLLLLLLQEFDAVKERAAAQHLSREVVLSNVYSQQQELPLTLQRHVQLEAKPTWRALYQVRAAAACGGAA
jgi:hypothetical protein